jgi:tetratricopeptide (TPR) repeat protein
MAEIAGKDTTKLEIEKSQNQSQAARERYNTALEEYNKLKGQNSKFAVERRKELKEQLDIERAFLRDERYARQQARAQNKADKIQAAEEEREEKLKEKRKQYEEATKELEEIRDKQLKPVELEKIKVRQEGLKALQGSINQEALMRQQAADLELLQLQVKAQRARKIEEQSQSFRVKAVQDGLSAIASITELFGRKSEKAAKRAFQVQKAANMASALISTYQSATAAYASQFTPVPTPDSPIRGGIAAGIAVATGLANVAKIAQQKFESPSSSGGGGNVSGGGGGVMSPNFNIVGNSGMNQLAQIQQQPIQAYVVSGEVTSAQALDRNRIKNATL